MVYHISILNRALGLLWLTVEIQKTLLQFLSSLMQTHLGKKRTILDHASDRSKGPCHQELGLNDLEMPSWALGQLNTGARS